MVEMLFKKENLKTEKYLHCIQIIEKVSPNSSTQLKKWIPKNFLKLETKHEKLELNFDEKCSIVKKKELKKKPLDFTKLPKSNSVQKNTNCDK